MTMSTLSPMAQEMRKAVLELPGLKPTDIDRVLQVLVSCEAIMLEAMGEFVAERVKRRFTEVFSIGFGMGVAVASIIAATGYMLS